MKTTCLYFVGSSRSTRVWVQPGPRGARIVGVERAGADRSAAGAPSPRTSITSFSSGPLPRSVTHVRAATLVVSREEVAYRVFQMGAEQSGTGEAVARFEAAQLLAGAPEQVWDVVLGPTREGKTDVLLASCPLARVESFCEQIESHGAPVTRVVDTATALFTAFRAIHRAEPRLALVVRIGTRSTQLVLIEGEHVQARSCPVGGEMLTLALAEETGLPRAEAEALKRTLPDPAGTASEDRSPEQAALAKAAGAWAGRLQLEITRFLVNQRVPGVPAASLPIYVCGGGACLRGLSEALEARLRMPVRAWDVRERLQADPEVVIGADDWMRAPEWLGAALLSFEPSDPGPALCLLPPARKRQRQARSAHATWAGAAALVALAGLPPAWHYHRLAQEATLSVQALESEVQRLQQSVDRNREHLRQIEAARERLTVLRELSLARQRWPRFLAELQSSLDRVEDAWLDSLQLDRSTPAGAGGALRFRLSGRLLDDPSAAVAVGPEAEGRIRSLLSHLERSPLVAGVERERFERLEPGVLRFEVILAMQGDEVL